jgi:hypothetical protein
VLQARGTDKWVDELVWLCTLQQSGSPRRTAKQGAPSDDAVGRVLMKYW